VEAALAASRGTVCAIERNADAIELMHKNREAFGLTNLVVVEGEAPAALVDLPAPDRVFIGGSAGNLDAIIETALSANPRARICVTAITLETLSALLECLRSRGIEDADIVQVSVARADKVGSYHLMRAENPIYIITADFGGGDV